VSCFGDQRADETRRLPDARFVRLFDVFVLDREAAVVADIGQGAQKAAPEVAAVRPTNRPKDPRASARVLERAREVRKPVGYAARAYSWMSPPRRSYR
jgi:hypothetical protein